MCFYFSNSRRALDLVNRYEFASGRIETFCEVQEAQYKITAFTHPACPVITANDGDNGNGGIGTAKWGLIPAWKKTVEDAEKSRKTCLNARAETVFELPSFRSPVLSKRCLIPATGYFEFHHRDKKAIPYYIFLKDEEIFSFGGLYEQWRNPAANETERTFAILTVPANRLCAGIHNGGKNPFRMPLIIRRDDESRWIDRSLKKPEIARFFQSFDANGMDAYPISGDFLKKNPGDASIICQFPYEPLHRANHQG